MDIKEELLKNSDKKCAAFQAKLTPTVERDKFIGVRVPILRNIAKEFMKTEQYTAFLDSLPHKYYDENLLHSVILSKIRDYDTVKRRVEDFLPYIDNWAVCDTLSPKVFAKNKQDLLKCIEIWVKSDKIYTVRFGVDMLMTHFLDDDFSPCYLEIAAKIKSEEYYINMMVAWFFATALAKQWDSAIPYLEQKRLSDFTHKKTIRKAIESFRITPEQKEYLRTLNV